MSTVIYGLRCHGQLLNFPSSTQSFFCGTMFRTRAAAEAHIPEFTRKCCSSDGVSSLYDLDPQYAQCMVVEYTLHDE